MEEHIKIQDVVWCRAPWFPESVLAKPEAIEGGGVLSQGDGKEDHAHPINSALVQEIEGVKKNVWDGQRPFDWSILAVWNLAPQWFLDEGPFKRPQRHVWHYWL
jgi:hypothetical protein